MVFKTECSRCKKRKDNCLFTPKQLTAKGRRVCRACITIENQKNRVYGFPQMKWHNTPLEELRGDDRLTYKRLADLS